MRGLEKIKTRMSAALIRATLALQARFSDFPVFKSVFPIDGSAIGVGV